jgi:hypothetical protein
MRNWLLLPLVLCGALSNASCTQEIDLTKALTATDVFSGYYDAGVVNGMNKLVPSISFRLQNVGDVTVRRVQVLVSFWQSGADGEIDSREITGITSDGVDPGKSSEPVLVRSAHGYTIEQPRNELFTHSQFKDFIVKVFVKRAGKIVPLNEFTVERRIIPQTTATSRP